MFAALPMYDHPGVRAETDALWAAIRDRLRDAGVTAPGSLTREDDLFSQWRDPELLLGQTCGLPYRAELHTRVTLIGTIDYGLEDTPPGHYRSVFVARASDPRSKLGDFDTALLAYNDSLSQSGWAAACAAPIRFRPGPITGSHRDSARIVGEGGAEIAAIDAITWRLIAAHTDLARGLKVVGHGQASPGMVLVTAFAEQASTLRTALIEGITDLSEPQRTALGIRGFVRTTPADYLAVPIPPSPEAYAASAA